MITHGQLQSQSMFVINPNPPWMNQIRNFNWLTALVFVLQFQTCWSDEEDHRDCGRRWRRAGCPYVSFYWNNLWPRWKVKVRSLLILMEFVLVVLKKKKSLSPISKNNCFYKFWLFHFTLNCDVQVPPHFPQVCSGGHSHNRIRLHATLYHVASTVCV